MITSKLGKLIIVDDEIDTLTPLCDLLSEWGYEVKGFTSGKDALEALKEKDSDMLLTDLVMPEMDGIALIKEAMEIDPLLVCMIMTGKGTIQTAVEAMKAGVFDYVLKPMEWKILKPVLSRAMEMRHLKKSEEKYRSIVEYQTDLICRWKPGEILTFVNDVYCRYFNKKPEELLGQSFITLIPEEDWDKVREHFASLSPENPVSTHEHRVFCTNGEICWQQWTNRAFFDEKGNIIEYQSVGCDITECKRAAEALQESEERFRRLYERAPLGYQSLDEEGRFIDVNQAWLDLLGYSRDEVIGRWFGDFLAPHEIDAFKERFPRFKATGTVHVDLEMVRRDNSIIVLHIDGQIGRDEEGQFKQTHCILYDITERKRAEEALKAERKRLHDVLEAMPIMVCLLTPDYHVAFANRAFRDKFGESHGRHCYEYCFGKKEPCDFCETYRVLKTGKPHHWQVTTPDVASVIDVYDFPFTDVDGSPMILEVDIDITERKRTEEALRKSEERYRDLYDNAPDMYHTLDKNGIIIECNETEARMLGYKKEEIIGRPVTDFFSEESKKLFEIDFPRLKGAKKLLNLEREFVRKDGSTFPAMLNVFAEYDEKGKFFGSKTISRDVTVLKQSGEALRKSEERYRLLFNNVSDAIFVHGVSQDISVIGKFKIIEVNDVACKYLGYTREELLQMNIAELDAPETLENIPQILNKLFTQGRATWEGIHIHKDGSRIPVEISIQLFKLYEKPMVLSSVRDITERKKAENALKESEERLRSLTEAAYEGIVFHKEGILLRANDQFFRMFGYEPDELFGKQIVQILVAPEAREFMKEQIACGKTGPYESIGLKKDGTKFPMEIRARETELKGEKIRVATAMDITGRKQAEEELKKSHEQLRAIAARLTEVEESERRRITQELHDNVGQNLTALDINLNILPGLLSVKSKTRIGKRLEDMHKLLEDTVKKIRDVMADLRPSVLDDYGLMAALRWYSEQFSNRTGITAVVHGKELELRMPSVVETTFFRIVQEALTNVSKHAQTGKVTIKLTKKDNLIRLSIADDGIGFDPENIQQSKESYVWGLIFMKERAVAMGGDLHIKSKPGKGTTITVEILRK